MKKIAKYFVILFLAIMLCGCTKILKTEDNKVVKNEETGLTVTENILCQPTDKELNKLYEANGLDITKLPKCSEMKIGGEYESIWTSIFVRPLAWLILKITSLVNSTGWALIIVTLIIRILLFPITQKTAMQSESIKKAQPEINKLEEKYKDKKDNDSMSRKGQEMMIIYKKYNISPLSGCLFSMLQIPLLFAFLEAINRVPAIFEENFLGIFQMGITPSIAIKAGQWYYIVLIILIVLSTYFSFKMNQTTATPEMQKQNKMMMWFMVVFVGIMSFQLSSAVAIYWITSTLFTILQNVYTDKIKSKVKNNA